MMAMMNATFPKAPTLAEIHAAAHLLAPHIIRSPLLRLNAPDDAREIYLKLENLQPIGAYKVRSMGNAMLTAGADALRNGVYTASSGNAGIGLAWMAQRLGIAATVYAPEGSPAGKLNAIQKFGAHIRLLSDDQWWQVIENSGHPTDPGLYVDAVRSPVALAGNATIGLEIIEQLPEVDTIIAPFGGGGVICGIAAAMRLLKPGTRIIAAESDAATPATAALQAGRPVPVAVKPSFISGAGAPCVLKEMWPLVSELVDDTIVVPVSGVAASIRLLCLRNHVVAEGAGAIPVAAALAAKATSDKIVCVITGGNIDLDVLARILQHQL
ncbi:MAG TPA: pyridoxal-phosphate dependent enzyme [Xanthomonadales bacterium]|nr:pyridoxal-phosphate dependent enzyme [Xanthomonadales bacterium]